MKSKITQTANVVLIVCVMSLLVRGGVIRWPDNPIVPPVSPAPFACDGLHVLIVEESGERGQLPPSQAAIITSVILREAIDAAGGEFQRLDRDQEPTGVWGEAMAVPRESLPWIVISNGRTGTSEPLPTDIEKTIDLIRRFE